MLTEKKVAHNEKLRHIVNTARDLFYRYGIRRVTVEEICKTSKVSKMTFYKYFANKTDLAKYLVNDIVEEAEQKYLTICTNDRPFTQKVEQIIQFKLDYMKNIGAEFITDLLKNPEPEIAAIYQKKRDKTIEHFITFMQQAQEQGDVRKDIKIEFINYILNKLTSMTTDQELEKLYNSPHDLVSEIVNFFFYGIMEK